MGSKADDADFIGRKAELAGLEERYRSRQSHFVVVYGRRRIGKSALLRIFCQKKRAIFHVGDRSTKRLQIKKVLESAAESLKEPLLNEVSINEWHRLFEILNPRLFKAKTILVFDEFQWMCETSPELPSVLQQYWDRHWEKSGKVFLVLCGSYVGFMEREVLGKRSPLFGRRTAQIWLKPFSHMEARKFHPAQNLDESARIYGLCGGIPAYLLSFDDRLSVEENILREALEDEGRLREEPHFLMMEELREPAIYYAILESLQTGRLSVTELSRRIHLDKGNLVYYLNTLQALGHVEKEIPLGGVSGVKAHGQYRIRDPLLRFWFSLVYPFLTDLTQREPREVFLSKVKPRLEPYWGKQFERLCRESVPHLFRKSRITASAKVGSYWDSRIQIDVVIEREDGITCVGECKWQKALVGMETLNELRKKMESFPNPKGNRLIPQLYSRSGFTKAVLDESGVQTFTLKDLY